MGVLKLSIYAEGYFVSPQLLQNQAKSTSGKKLSAKQLIWQQKCSSVFSEIIWSGNSLFNLPRPCAKEPCHPGQLLSSCLWDWAWWKKLMENSTTNSEALRFSEVILQGLSKNMQEQNCIDVLLDTQNCRNVQLWDFKGQIQFCLAITIETCNFVCLILTKFPQGRSLPRFWWHKKTE